MPCKIHQRLKCTTRGENTLNNVYSNVELGFGVKLLPNLGQSDDMSLHLIPVYTPLRKIALITTRTVETWPEGTVQELQDWFETTNWEVFEHPVLQQYTAAVTDTVTVKRCWICQTTKIPG